MQKAPESLQSHSSFQGLVPTELSFGPSHYARHHRLQIISCVKSTNRFHLAVRLFSNRSQSNEAMILKVMIAIVAIV